MNLPRSAALAIALLALTTSQSLAQTAACNDVYKKRLSPPHYQPDSEVTESCGESSITLTVELHADGSIGIASAGATQTASITLSTPPSCPTQMEWHEEELYGCETQLSGWHCNPQGKQVPVKFYSSVGCPELPVGDVLLAVLNWNVSAIREGFSLPTIPLTVPCSPMVDITSQSPPSARFRWSAKASLCGSSAAEPQATRVEVDQWGGGETAVTSVGLFGETVSDQPSGFDYSPYLPAGEFVGNLAVVEGLDDLALLLAPLAAPSEVAVMNDVASLNGAVGWIDDLSISVTSHAFLATGDVVSSRGRYFGKFRGNGDFEVHQPGVIPAADANGIDVAYSVSFTRVDGTIFSGMEGAASGAISPGENGAATEVLQGPLAALDYVQTWLADPFGLMLASYVVHEELPGPTGGQVLVTQTTPLTLPEGTVNNELSRALFGRAWTYLIDTQEERILRAEQVDLVTGNLRSVLEFGSYANLHGDVWRPMEVKITEFDQAGQVFMIREYDFGASRRSASASPAGLRMPRPVDNTWFLRAE